MFCSNYDIKVVKEILYSGPLLAWTVHLNLL